MVKPNTIGDWDGVRMPWPPVQRMMGVMLAISQPISLAYLGSLNDCNSDCWFGHDDSLNMVNSRPLSQRPGLVWCHMTQKSTAVS
jgi:hypothetical protein